MSRAPRFFISPEQVVGPIITITGDDVRHIATVLRMMPGEELLLCDGRGNEYSVTIASIDRSRVTADVLSRNTRPLSSPHITLCQGLPKFDKMDLIAQKATELGVAAIIPLVTERTVVKLKDEARRISRWQKICREAAMQSNRPDIPVVEPVQTLAEFLGGLPDPPSESLLLLPWEEGTEPVKNVLRARPAAKHITVIIGPEGGLAAREAGMARDKGFHQVSLGSTILRTETAAIAVLSMIHYEFQD